MVKGELVRQPTACRESASVAAEDMRKSLELLQLLEMEVGGNKLVGEITACVFKALLELEHTGGEDHMTVVVGSDQNCSEVIGKSESSTVRRKNKQGFDQKKMARRRRSHPYTSTEKRSNLEDGLTWRKYGQKEIHGAKYPRSYYRCTYKKTSGCKATRQTQKSEEDESIYLITYIGHHTCNNHPSSSSTNNSRSISFGGGHESPEDMLSESPSTPVTKKHEGVDDQNVLMTGVVRCDGFSSLQEELELPIETSHTITATVDDYGSVVTSEYLDMGLLEEDDYYNSLDYSYLQGFNLTDGYIFQV